MTPAALTVKIQPPPWLAVIAAMRAGSFRTELQLQDAVNAVLTKQRSEAFSFEREHTLPRDAGRIDFAATDCGIRYGIECKTGTAGADTWGQLERYAPHFDVLILVTTKALADVIPLRKPVFLVNLWMNL